MWLYWTRNPVVDVLAKLAQRFVRNSNAPAAAFGELGHLGRLVGAQPAGQVDGSAALARPQAGIGCDDQIPAAGRGVDDVVASIDAHGRAVHGAQPQKRVLGDADSARDIVLAQGVEIRGDPFTAELFPPHFIARSAGLPRIVKAGHSAPRAGGASTG